jgi:hypothetical protein
MKTLKAQDEMTLYYYYDKLANIYKSFIKCLLLTIA